MVFRHSAVILAGAVLGLCVTYMSAVDGQQPPSLDQLQFFEKNIRPVLVKECYSCHSATADEIEGGLTLDTREGIRKGGDTGPAVVPGSASRSLLLKAIKQTDDDLQMPPKKKLSPEVIANFEKWITVGAVDPRDGEAKVAEKYEIDIEKGRQFWAFQALTVACARCHDHRFDPIPQSDYYALAGIFRSTETCYGTIRVIQSNHPSRLLELPEEADVTVALEPLSTSRRESIEKQIQDQRDRLAELTSRDDFIRRIFMQSRVTQLRSQLDSYDAEGNPMPMAMGVREGRFVSDSPLHIRGEVDQPGERVRRGFPQVLIAKQPTIRFRSSGRRELADWIASKENPLSARVMVNRVWLHLMGRGLVSTPDNFGASGQRPSHPELLDRLAVAFVENGWSVKKLIRAIVLSRAYQLSSQFDEKNFEVDPDNVLAWRMPKRRLESEALRDAMLQLGGRLDFEAPAGSLVALGGEGNVGFRIRGDPSATDTHRSVYLPIVRDQLPEMLTIFDFPDPSLIIGERSTTTIPAQSLYMMNNAFVIRQAEGMASSLLSASEDDVERVKRAYRQCYSREPTDSEVNNALKFLQDYGQDHAQRSTWAAFCQAMFASAEFAQR